MLNEGNELHSCIFADDWCMILLSKLNLVALTRVRDPNFLTILCDHDVA